MLTKQSVLTKSMPGVKANDVYKPDRRKQLNWSRCGKHTVSLDTAVGPHYRSYSDEIGNWERKIAAFLYSAIIKHL